MSALKRVQVSTHFIYPFSISLFNIYNFHGTLQQWATFARIWHIYDATWQNPFHSAELLKKYLTGSYKPIYHPLSK